MFFNHAQELRDTHITAKEPAAPAEDAEIELWQQQALAHLRVQVKDTGEMMKRAAATKKAKKLHRVPAHDYGLALGHALSVCGCPPDSVGRPPARLPGWLLRAPSAFPASYTVHAR